MQKVIQFSNKISKTRYLFVNILAEYFKTITPQRQLLDVRRRSFDFRHVGSAVANAIFVIHKKLHKVIFFYSYPLSTSAKERVELDRNM